MADLLNGIPKFSHAHKEPCMQRMFKGWTHLEFFNGQLCMEVFIDTKGIIKYSSYLCRYFINKPKEELLNYIGDKYKIKETVCP